MSRVLQKTARENPLNPEDENNTIDQVRDLLFGDAQRGNDERIKALEKRQKILLDGRIGVLLDHQGGGGVMKENREQAGLDRLGGDEVPDPVGDLVEPLAGRLDLEPNPRLTHGLPFPLMIDPAAG